MHRLDFGTVALLGYGVSNIAMCEYFLKHGIRPVVRGAEPCHLPEGVKGIFGKDYLCVSEDVAFRSPAIRPDRIGTGARIYTESIYALSLAKSFKIGITGSDGKTTTSTLAYRMLLEGNKSAFLCGNVGKPVIDIAPRLSEGDFLVAELSSFQLIGEAPELDVAAITNVSPNHLDWHRDMEEYIDAKKCILKKAATAVLNYDDLLLRGLAKEGNTCFSLENCTKMLDSGINLVHVVNGTVCYNREELFPVADIKLKGDFNVQNVLCATACTYKIAGKDACHKVAREFCGVCDRMEHIDTVNGVSFICSAIDSTPTRTLKTLGAMPVERTVCILGGYDKCLDYSCLGKTLDRLKAIVLCGENRDKISSCTVGRVFNVNTLEEATSLAYSLAASGDFVILSPASASFDMFKNYKEKAKCFKEAVRRLKNGKY